MNRIFNLLLLHIFVFGSAQNVDRIFHEFSYKSNDYKIVVNDGFYQIKFYNENIVETTFIPNNESFNKSSHAVIKIPENIPIGVKESDESIQIDSEILQVHISKKPFQISYFKKDKLIISEKEGYAKDSLESINFNINPTEVLYGGGARALGMNRRGYKLELYNRAHYGYERHSELMNYTMPIVLSSKKYLIHFDNAPIGFLDLDSKKNNTIAYKTISGRKTYQVVVGEDWYNLVENYTDLTGRQPMLPQWAFGNFSSRFGYHSQSEVLNTVNEFKKKEVPLDAIILDLFWFGKEIRGTMGNLAFDKDSFPEPKRMIQELCKKDVETVLITEPFILTTSNRWEEAIKEDILAKDSLGKPYTYDFYFGHTGLIDIYDPKGYNWFKKIYKDLFDYGVTGMWGDLGEPEVHPKSLVHAKGTANEVHNIFGHDWARLVQDAYNTYTPNQRPFILMRAGYSGSQRYGIVPWSGDVNRTWGGLHNQPEIALQMGMQGVAYMHSDLGGFAGDLNDDELYLRWLQYGVFQPIYRPHAQEAVPSEPVFKKEETFAVAKEAIELRYKLLPYNYSLMYENMKLGHPLMRPLFFDEPDNKAIYNKSDSYLWGKDFLISPVMHKGLKTQEVYFPQTSDWIDFYTHDKFFGGDTQVITLHKNYIPTFVRSGAIIPMVKPIQSTKEYNGNDLEIHYYYDATIKNSFYEMYNDDGTTRNAYKKEMYELLQFHVKNEVNTLTLNLDATIGNNFSSSIKEITWVIHVLDKTPKEVEMSGNSFNIDWKDASKTLKVITHWDTQKSKTISIKLKNK